MALSKEASVKFLEAQLENYETQRYRNDVETSILVACAEQIGEDYKSAKEIKEHKAKVAAVNEELDIAIATINGFLAELK